MNKITRLVVIATIFLPATFVQADLVGSFLAPNTFDVLDQQTVTGVTRDLTGGGGHGNANTLGIVPGSVNVSSGQQVGTSSYNGIDLRTFSAVTQFNELNRFASGTGGGLVTWDFDLSSYLAGVTVGPGPGETCFSIDLDFSNRTTAQDGLFFISYNGGGLTLDTSDITQRTFSGNASGAVNYNLVTDTNLYQAANVLTTASGTSSFDITADMANIQAGDGMIRVAYINRNFRGDIHLLNESGIVSIVHVPEPSTLSLLGIVAGIGLIRRRRT